jgi:glycosyltransferase involved in cell wall biosynthesis
MEGDIKELVASSDRNPDIRMLGYLSQQQTLGIYSVANFLLLPSYSDPNPLTCIESLWSGLPLFVSDHVGNFPETVKEGVNGYVFSFGNENTVFNALDKIASHNQDWYNEAKQVSLKIAEELYEAQAATENCWGSKEIYKLIDAAIRYLSGYVN